MQTKTVVMAVAAGAGLRLLVSRLRRSRVRTPAADSPAETRNRWRAVTVNKPAADVAADGVLPSPLAELGDRVEVRITPAPGGKGTEIAARLCEPEPRGKQLMARLGRSDPRYAVRSALRESKVLIETGEVLRTDPRPAGRRPATPSGKLLDAVIGRGREEGML